MRFAVGSTNNTKIDAVTEALENSAHFSDAKVFGTGVAVELYGHPKTLEETIAGARDRARQAFNQCDYSVGIEGGLMSVPYTKTGFMEVAACAIYDGATFHIGLSPAYEWPQAVLDGILKEGLDGSQAMRQAGITNLEKIGAGPGAVGVFSKGRLDRKEFNKSAVIMALFHLENPEHY
jgi:inosine/xanthosine triphosphatase